MPPSAPIRALGHCYCGTVSFEVSLAAGDAPIFTAYCHCDSCRRAHAAPLYHVVCVDQPAFRVTGGEDHLRGYTRPGGHIERVFCDVCGSKVLNRFGGWRPGGKTPIAFFPSLLDEATQHALPEAFRPHKHNHPGESVLDPDMLADFFDHA